MERLVSWTHWSFYPTCGIIRFSALHRSLVRTCRGAACWCLSIGRNLYTMLRERNPKHGRLLARFSPEKLSSYITVGGPESTL
jgi:hypothetical protein